MQLAKTTEIHTGCLLLAEPFMNDENFRRAVVLITEYKEDGVIGFALHQSSGLTLEDALPEFEGIDHQLFIGGPVQRNTLHYIHTLGDIVEESVPIGGGLYWSGNFDTIRELLNDRMINHQQIRFIVGYSGWGYTQLKEEIEMYNSWVVSENPYQNIFLRNHENLWRDLMKLKGKNYSEMADYPEQPWLN
jgi:putative transcriptional regulator